MNTYYATLGCGQPFYPGYFEVKAETEFGARKICCEQLNGRYCGLYFQLEDIHELDRVYRGTLTEQRNEPH